jgi:hypothetical protein
MSETQPTNDTSVKEVNIDEINDILDIGGSIMLPDEEKKPNIFTDPKVDTTFLDKPLEEEEDDEKKAVNVADDTDDDTPPNEDEDTSKAKAPVDTDDFIQQPGNDIVDDEDDSSKNKGGRPTSFVSAAKKLIEEEWLLPFDDGKKIEEYTAEDIEELLKANMEQKAQAFQESLPQQFFSNMPVELQAAYDYFAKGGTDVKGILRDLATTREVQELSSDSESGQINIVRTYLQAKQFGSPDEIEEEIQSLQDRGDLEKKANQFKPKLDSMQEQVIAQKLAYQEQESRRRHEQSQMYMDSVYTTLEEGDLNGIKLDNRTQNLLYAGLTQPNSPSMSGRQTNLLGHLIEKYQWQEPNHGILAEALWLLADPEGYKSEIKQSGEKEVVGKTVRQLKTAQSNLSSSTATDTDTGKAPARNKKPGLSRPKKNFFARG